MKKLLSISLSLVTFTSLCTAGAILPNDGLRTPKSADKKILREINPAEWGFKKINVGKTRSTEAVEMIRKAKVSTGMITTFNAKGEEQAIGSGFFIAPDVLITNIHVVRGASKATIKVGTQIVEITGVLGFCSGRDQVKLMTQGLTVPSLPVAPTPPELAEAIWVIGNPKGLEGSVSDGIVSAVRDDLIQISAPINPGNSGGPVLNLKGEVVAVSTLTLKDSQNLNFGYRVLDIDWRTWEKPLTLIEFSAIQRVEAQADTFPKLQKTVNDCAFRLLQRNGMGETGLATLKQSGLSGISADSLSEVARKMSKTEGDCLLQLRVLSDLLQDPKKDYGSKLTDQLFGTYAAINNVVYGLILTYGMDQKIVKGIRDKGGPFVTNWDAWDDVISSVQKENRVDGDCLKDLLVCSIATGYYASNSL